jgi:hypothetical protein
MAGFILCKLVAFVLIAHVIQTFTAVRNLVMITGTAVEMPIHWEEEARS